MTRLPALGKLSRFAAVGVLTAGVYTLVLLAGLNVFKVSLPIAGALAYAIALPINYLLHRRWTFRSDRSHGAALPRYGVNLVLGLVLNSAFLNAARHLGPLEVTAVQVAAMVCLSVSSYLIMAAWVFVAPRPTSAALEA